MPKTTDLSQTAIDPALPKFQALLKNLQGNILRPRRRTHAALIFFTFKPGRSAEARAWIRNFAATRITSARSQSARGAARKPFCSLLLSAAGYRALGSALRLPADPNFRAGMKRARARLKDPAPRTWEKPYRGSVHALVIVGALRLSQVNRLAVRVRKDLKSFAGVLTVERGREWRNADNQVVEHFGYADGLSQPQFLKTQIDRLAQTGDGTDVWNPSAPLRLVLARDPNARTVDAFGSYLVFRKLEQNVAAFMKREKDMTEALELFDPGAGLAGALMVGRFRDGTPVTLSPVAGMSAPSSRRSGPKLVAPNNFTYAEDRKGSRCPFQAHVRSVNPRDRGSLASRIVRCGITYGKRRLKAGHFATAPARGRGLLFMCFQRDIGRQFEWLQRRANGMAGRPADPLIGQRSRGAAASLPTHYGQRLRVRYPSRASLRGGPAEGLVTLKGGEYFFAPSLPFLKGL